MAGSVNKVILIGNLGADPEVRTFQNGGKVVNLRIATSEQWKDRNSGERQERTQWHSVAIFSEPLARIAEPTQVALSEAQTKWLAAVAEYRSTHRIGSDDLLGGPTRSLDADAVRLLAAADDITSAHAQPVAAAPAVPPAPSRGARLELE